MRRNGPQATRLVRRCEDEAITLRGDPITGRRLERLHQDGMLPRDADDDQIIECLKALDALDYGRGKCAVEAALELLIGGIEVRLVERVRIAVGQLIEWGQQRQNMSPMVGKPTTGSANPTPDVALIRSLSRIMAPVRRRVDAAVADVPDREDAAGAPIRDTAKDRQRSLDQVARCILANQRPKSDDIEKFIAVKRSAEGIFGPDPKRYQRVTYTDDEDAAADIFELVGSDVHDYPTRAAKASLEELEAGAATWMKTLDEALPGVDQRQRVIYAVMLLSPVPIPFSC